MSRIYSRSIPDVVVIGAGLSGLAAARAVEQSGRRALVLEATQRPGGRVHTERHDEAILEHGGLHHTAGQPAFRRLLEEIGLDQTVRAAPDATSAAVATRFGRKHVDFASPKSLLRSRGVGRRSARCWQKATKAAREAAPADLGDLASLAHLDDRSAAEGLSSTVRHLTGGLHEAMWGVPSSELSQATLALQFAALGGEQREIGIGTDRLVALMATDLVVRYGHQAEKVVDTGDGVEVLLDDGQWLQAHAAVLACPADVAARIWPDAPPAVRDHLEATTYSRGDYGWFRLRGPLILSAQTQPAGLSLFPGTDGFLGSVQSLHRWADDGGLWLAKAAPGASTAEMPDEEVLARLQAALLQHHPETRGQITGARVMRHDRVAPVMGVGSVRRLVRARFALPDGRIDLAGDHMTAPWLEGAVRAGQLAAERVMGLLGPPPLHARGSR